MGTESRNPNSMNLSELSALEIVRLMNQEDAAVLTAVGECVERIAEASQCYSETLRNGGRVFYLGAGTSGGLALIDAAEVPPTFGLSDDKVIALTAEDGIYYTTNDEDDPDKAERQLREHNLTSNDFVIGLASSGSTPYVLHGLKYATSIGAKTASVACNKNSLIGQVADIAIEADTGPEVLTGSTRLKAGTAEKMILNMLSTSAMVSLGKVVSNFMVDVKPMNEKLQKRAKSIIIQITGCGEAEAEAALRQCNDSVSQAIRLIQG